MFDQRRLFLRAEKFIHISIYSIGSDEDIRSDVGRLGAVCGEDSYKFETEVEVP